MWDSRTELTLKQQSSENEKDDGTRLPKKRLFAVGLIIVFGIEFILRDFLLSANASDINVGLALVGEWLVLAFLVFL